MTIMVNFIIGMQLMTKGVQHLKDGMCRVIKNGKLLKTFLGGGEITNEVLNDIEISEGIKFR